MTSPSLTSQPRPKAVPAPLTRSQKARAWLIPLGLFVVTLGSTTAVGMRYMYNFQAGRPPLSTDADVLPYAWVAHHLGQIAQGLPFSITLIGILLAHEFGHYFACRFYRVRSTLPYMLPAPSLSGTFGAVIRLKSRVPSRAALIVIGAAGPIAGFVVALFTGALGLTRSVFEVMPTLPAVQSPLLLHLFRHVFAMPSLVLLLPHPILSATWIGLLITALNLVPAGQLDGGHIVYALSPDAHRIVSRGSTVGLLLLGVFFWVGWLFWGAVLLLPSMRHPRIVGGPPLKLWQIALMPICLLLLLLAGTYRPFPGYSLLDILHRHIP